jgi:hypothetical protein
MNRLASASISARSRVPAREELRRACLIALMAMRRFSGVSGALRLGETAITWPQYAIPRPASSRAASRNARNAS